MPKVTDEMVLPSGEIHTCLSSGKRLSGVVPAGRRQLGWPDTDGWVRGAAGVAEGHSHAVCLKAL